MQKRKFIILVVSFWVAIRPDQWLELFDKISWLMPCRDYSTAWKTIHQKSVFASTTIYTWADLGKISLFIGILTVFSANWLYRSTIILQLFTGVNATKDGQFKKFCHSNWTHQKCNAIPRSNRQNAVCVGKKIHDSCAKSRQAHRHKVRLPH